MFARLVPAALVAAGLLAAHGCGPAKLDQTKTLELDTGDAKAVDLVAQPKPQTLNVSFNSSAGDVSVYLFKEEDAKGDDGLVSADPKKALAQKKGKSESFVYEVPANTPVRVIVRGANAKTSVELKVTNQK